MNKECYLGLDVSTTHLGICLLNDKDEILHLDSINTPTDKYNTIWKKIEKIKEELALLHRVWIAKGYDVTYVGVEEWLKAFRPGGSSAEVIINLSRMNALVSYLVIQEFGLEPLYISVTTARARLGIKIDKKDKTISNKEKVFNIVRTKIVWNWPTKVISRGKNKGNTVFEDECLDMVDAYIQAAALRKICNT